MDALAKLVHAFRCLPGVGPKSAQRMAYQLLNNQRDRGLHLASCLQEAMQTIRHCDRCNNYTTEPFCALCRNQKRNFSVLCVVENPADVLAIEQSQSYQGAYYVLMGKISPLDGMGPEEIGLPKFQQLIEREPIEEVILALSPSIEGQTTSHFIHDILRHHPIRVSQLAHGIPSGGELEFLDGNTIGNALRNRLAF